VPLFVVINEAGPSWADGVAMRQQAKWSEHAGFINRLMAEGTIVLGGPLTGGPRHRALLIVHAANESSARAALVTDPWISAGILRAVSFEPWEILVSDDRLDPVLAEILRTA
jgi:uncharacterized protein YciI